MTKLQIFLLSLAFVFGIFLTYEIMSGKLRRQEAAAVEVAKKSAVLESKYLDSLKDVRSQLLTLVETSSKRTDSLQVLADKKQRIEVVIRKIHELPLTSEELLSRFNKRYATD